MTNELRMPFAQWVAEMREAGVSWQGRYLAMNVAIFRVEGNAELSMLSEIEGRTLEKYKSELRKGGWIVPSRVGGDKGGRGVRFEPLPSRKETPVNFTDLIPRKGGKYYPGNEEANTGVISAGVAKNTPVISAEVKESFPRTPFKETTKPIIVEKQTTTTTTVEYDAASGGGEISEYLNGSAVDIAAFISKHAMVDGRTAQSMLANNVKAFTADAMLEAYSVTLADMASGMIARPYKYLIEIARKLKDRKAAQRGDGRSERWDRRAKEIAAKIQGEDRRR